MQTILPKLIVCVLLVAGNKMTSKAQGNTFWIVITAIIALVVLVILLLIFTGKTGSLEAGLLGCESKGGFCTIKGTNTAIPDCQTAAGKCINSNYDSCSSSSAFTCKSSTDICCLGVKKK